MILFPIRLTAATARRTAVECAPTTDMRSPQKDIASGLRTMPRRCALRASGSNE